MKASLCVHSYNEGPAIERLILSSLHAADHISEWVVLDHRSDDNTQALLDQLEPLLLAHGIPLVRIFEQRDLSQKHTFAHVRSKTIAACRSTVVALMDADFILGPAFASTIRSAIPRFTDASNLAAIAYPVPVVWDHLQTDEQGSITSHGRVWIHGAKARILHRERITYRQRGKWEKAVYPDPTRTQIMNVGNDGSVLVSANTKPPERLELRRTMTMFMEDAMNGITKGSWLDDVAAGRTRNMPPYKFRDVDLKGKRLNLAGLDL